MTPDELAAAFPGSTWETESTALGPCGYCGQPLDRGDDGKMILAAPCDKAGRHITFADNALRIEFGMTWGAYWAKVETYGLPHQNRLSWVQPKDKARKWQPNPRVAGGVLHRPRDTMSP